VERCELEEKGRSFVAVPKKTTGSREGRNLVSVGGDYGEVGAAFYTKKKRRDNHHIAKGYRTIQKIQRK